MSSSTPTPTQAAYLTLPETTVTAFAVPGNPSELVVDGTTLTYRGDGYTVADPRDPVVVYAGNNGLEDSTTTAFLGPIGGRPGGSSGNEGIGVSSSGSGGASSSSIVVTTTTSGSQVSSASSSQTSAPSETGGSESSSGSGSGNTPTSKPPGTSGQGSGADGSGSSSSSSNAAASPTFAAGKVAVVVLGALGGFVGVGIGWGMPV